MKEPCDCIHCKHYSVKTFDPREFNPKAKPWQYMNCDAYPVIVRGKIDHFENHSLGLVGTPMMWNKWCVLNGEDDKTREN